MTTTDCSYFLITYSLSIFLTLPPSSYVLPVLDYIDRKFSKEKLKEFVDMQDKDGVSINFENYKYII